MTSRLRRPKPDYPFDTPSDPARTEFTDQEEQRIARQVEQLRACAGDYARLHEDLLQKRLAWWEANHRSLALAGSLPRQAYTLVLLVYLRLDQATVPVVYEDERTIIWRSTNFCPTLEACRFRSEIAPKSSTTPSHTYHQIGACIISQPPVIHRRRLLMRLGAVGLRDAGVAPHHRYVRMAEQLL